MPKEERGFSKISLGCKKKSPRAKEGGTTRGEGGKSLNKGEKKNLEKRFTGEKNSSFCMGCRQTGWRKWQKEH